MNKSAIPDLADTWNEVWNLLGAHLHRNAGPRQFVTLASVDATGAPRLRTVALRALDPAAARLQIYTDAQSDKIAEIEGNPAVSILAWAPEPRVQIRLSGQARIETGESLRALWEAQPPEARLNYSHHPAPGHQIDACDAYVQTPSLARFARLTVAVEHIDHVNLADSGHRRARFLRTDDWQGQWLSP